MNAKTSQQYMLSVIANPSEVRTLREALQMEGWLPVDRFTRRTEKGMNVVLLFSQPRGGEQKGSRYMTVEQTQDMLIDIKGAKTYLSKSQALKYISILGTLGEGEKFENTTPDITLLKPVKQLRGGPVVTTKLITVNAE